MAWHVGRAGHGRSTDLRAGWNCSSGCTSPVEIHHSVTNACQSSGSERAQVSAATPSSAWPSHHAAIPTVSTQLRHCCPPPGPHVDMSRGRSLQRSHRPASTVVGPQSVAANQGAASSRHACNRRRPARVVTSIVRYLFSVSGVASMPRRGRQVPHRRWTACFARARCPHVCCGH